jgi:hypothetical protein
MKILLSFCNNAGDYDHPNLLIVDYKTIEKKWIKMDFVNNGFTGVNQDEEFIYALYQSVNSGLVVIDKKTHEIVFVQHLQELKDPHSLAVDGKHIYIVSSGTDQILKYHLNITKRTIDLVEQFWSPQDSIQTEDTHHINSIFISHGNIFISAFGHKKADTWSSAEDGYVYNISQSKQVLEHIFHPHAIFVKNDDIYYCESALRNIKKNDEIIVHLESGYIRGLFLDENILVFGTSGGRKVSKSTGLENTPAEAGLLNADCRMLLYKRGLLSGKYELADELNFFPEHTEIYDVMIIK